MLVRNLMIAVIASPELLVGLAVWALVLCFPSMFGEIGAKLVSDSENWKYVTAVPTGLFVWSATVFGDIRNPVDKDANRLLYNWPHYRLLVGRLYLALALSVSAAAVAISLWLFGKSLDHAAIGALFVGALGVSLVVAATLTFARSRVRELLVQHGPDLRPR